MNLRSIDLNLLVMLDVLLEERHVSRAADRLGLSQPATSSALNRCRALLKDPILVRSDGGLSLTPKASAIKAPLRELLSGLADVIDPEPIELARIRQTVKISTADHMVALLAGRLMADLAKVAPNIDVIFQPWNGVPNALEMLSRGSMDLAISIFADAPTDYHRHELLKEHWVVLLRHDHPAARNLTVENWISHPHAMMSGNAETRGILDEMLGKIGLRRHVAAVVPSFLIMPSIVMHSDLIAMMPSLSIPSTLTRECLVLKPPLEIEPFSLHLLWHDKKQSDPAVEYVRRVLIELAAALPRRP